ncbi:MAG: YceI family protein [Candidatus Acidiferrales bacterium]
MRAHKILLAVPIGAALAATAVHAQTDSRQIDSAHSTASISLNSSDQKSQPYNLAIAKVAGRLELDASKPANTLLSLNIYPSGQGSNLLTRDGAFQTGRLASLTKYTLLSFRSKRAFVTADGRLEVAGHLTAEHVQRPTNATWNVAYSGAVYEDPTVDRISGEVTFTFEMPASTYANAQGASPTEVSAFAVIERASFPGLWSALRDSDWPIVVLDKNCQMPYYIGPGLRDYKGVTCTGTPVLVTPYDDQSLTPSAIDSIGTTVPAPPTGDQIAIHVHLQLAPGNSDSSGRSHN